MATNYLESGEPFVELQDEEVCEVMNAFFKGIQTELEPYFDYGEGLCIYRVGIAALSSASPEIKDAVAAWNEVNPSGLYCTAAAAMCVFMDILNEQKESA